MDNFFFMSAYGGGPNFAKPADGPEGRRSSFSVHIIPPRCSLGLFATRFVFFTMVMLFSSIFWRLFDLMVVSGFDMRLVGHTLRTSLELMRHPFVWCSASYDNYVMIRRTDRRFVRAMCP